MTAIEEVKQRLATLKEWRANGDKGYDKAIDLYERIIAEYESK